LLSFITKPASSSNSDLYQKLVKVAGSYIGEDKAGAAIARQLQHCGATPEVFGKEHLAKISVQVLTVTTLYMSDDAMKSALTSKIKALG